MLSSIGRRDTRGACTSKITSVRWVNLAAGECEIARPKVTCTQPPAWDHFGVSARAFDAEEHPEVISLHVRHSRVATFLPGSVDCRWLVQALAHCTSHFTPDFTLCRRELLCFAAAERQGVTVVMGWKDQPLHHRASFTRSCTDRRELRGRDVLRRFGLSAERKLLAEIAWRGGAAGRWASLLSSVTLVESCNERRHGVAVTAHDREHAAAPGHPRLLGRAWGGAGICTGGGRRGWPLDRGVAQQSRRRRWCPGRITNRSRRAAPDVLRARPSAGYATDERDARALFEVIAILDLFSMAKKVVATSVGSDEAERTFPHQRGARLPALEG